MSSAISKATPARRWCVGRARFGALRAWRATRGALVSIRADAGCTVDVRDMVEGVGTNMAQAVADYLSDEGVARRLVRDGAYGAVARDLYERGADLVGFVFEVRSFSVSHVVGADSIDDDVRALKEWCDDVWDRRDVWPELVEVGVIVGEWYVWLDVRTGLVYVAETRNGEA